MNKSEKSKVVLNFGRIIRDKIANDGAAIQSLADRVGIKYNTLYKYFIDESVPSLIVAYKISKELGFSLDDLHYKEVTEDQRRAYRNHGTADLSKWETAAIENKLFPPEPRKINQTLLDQFKSEFRYKGHVSYQENRNVFIEQAVEAVCKYYKDGYPYFDVAIIQKVLYTYVEGFFAQKTMDVPSDTMRQIDELITAMLDTLDAMSKIWSNAFSHKIWNDFKERQLWESPPDRYEPEIIWETVDLNVDLTQSSPDRYAMSAT